MFATVLEKRHKMMTDREINDVMIEQIESRLKGNISPAANLKSIDEIVTELKCKRKMSLNTFYKYVKKLHPEFALNELKDDCSV